MSRLLQMEKRLDRNEDLRRQNNNFMKEYLELGHMSLIKNDDESGYYLPHHAVIRESSTTTKLRVVFDASARSSSGLSLNDCCYTGPTLQPELFDTSTKWRTHKIALNADVEKMYRQILVDTADRKYQKILWRFSTNEPIRTYELNTVTYGTSPAPLLAIKTLMQLPLTKKTIVPRHVKQFDNHFMLMIGCVAKIALQRQSNYKKKYQKF